VTSLENAAPMDRRALFRRSAVVAAGVAAASLPFDALVGRRAHAAPGRLAGAGYGPLRPVQDMTTGLELLKLPRGFEYMSFGWTGDLMSDGIRTPSAHDGMAAFRHADGVHLVRNHERGAGTPFLGADDAATYDPTSAGGTTTLVFDPDAGRLVESYASLSGTIRNCAGGPTPWGSWLTCEETTVIQPNGMRHGYVFDVPSSGKAEATPLKAMGRFSHEAVALDPATGIGLPAPRTPGTRRCTASSPDRPGDLTSGTARGHAPRGHQDPPPVDDRDRGAGGRVGPVANPGPGAGEPSTWAQASAQGAARIVPGEGRWYGNGVVYVVSTSGGPAGQGQVFATTRSSTASGPVRVPGRRHAQRPGQHLRQPARRPGALRGRHGAWSTCTASTPEGEIFPFAENAVVIPSGGVPGKAAAPGSYTGSEWCGAVFEPKNGNWLFANLQSPGITVAITGPWRQGGL
jgi:secreted PhoX family phosphatase